MSPKKPDAAEKGNSSLSKTEDGETLCRYAKAFWSINGDHEKALFYFEKAVEASPNDRYLLHNISSVSHLKTEMRSTSSVFGQYYSWRVRSVPMGNRRMIIKKKKKISIAEEKSKVHKLFFFMKKILLYSL